MLGIFYYRTMPTAPPTLDSSGPRPPIWETHGFPRAAERGSFLHGGRCRSGPSSH